MREVYLEGRLMTDRAAAHAEIKDKLSLPEYYGANLDALWDCLIEIERRRLLQSVIQALCFLPCGNMAAVC